MSDESVYYSPGEVDSTEATTEDSDIEIRKNLLSAFDDEPTKSKTARPEREPMKVYLRIRPFTPEEIKSKEDQSCLEYLNQKSILLRAPEDSFTFKSSIRGIAEQTHKFSFSKVYNDSICQKTFFDDSMLGYVKDFIDGVNCLVFTYGVTNSGKTFTIQGSPKNGGILPRTLDVLFNSIKEKQYDQINLKPTMYQDVTKLSKDQQKYEEALKSAIIHAGQKENIDLSILWKMDSTNNSDASVISSASSTSTYATANEPDYSSIAEELKERVCDGTVIDVKSQGPVKFCIWVSFAEIYNEYVYDLLDPTPTGKGKKRTVLKLSGDKKGNPFIKGLKEVQVNSADEAFKVLRVGQKNQNIAVTKLNQNSSRSHSIFTIKILRIVDVEDPHVVRISRLSFVDLAGSERYCKTQSTGDRLKEASNINTSIMTLGKCIEYLRYNQQHKNHPLIIPFRENKLTRLFQGFFLGKGKACMIVNISKCASVFDETFNVLKFSAVAKEVTTKTTRNTDIFKPKNIPKPSLVAATPISNGDKNNWLNVGLTTPRPIQREILNETMSDESQQIQALIKSYEEIRKQLIHERRKNALMELKIREEVCAEMSEQIVEIEKNYSERLQEEQQCLEEQCEKRIELLTKSMKKTRKRKKIDRIETEEDCYVSSVLLHAEKVKVKERDDTIIALRAKLAEKEISHEFFKQTHTPEQQPKAIASLESQLEEAKETLKRQEEHIEDLQNTMNFVQDKVDEKDTEIEKLKDMIESIEENADNNEILVMKDLLEKTSKALNEARVKLDARDEKIKDRDEKIRILEEKLGKEKGPINCDIEQFEKDLARLEEQTTISHQRNEFQADEIKQLRSEMEEITNEKKAISNEVDGLKRQLIESEERREQLQFRDEEMKGKMKRYETVIKNHETALTESENLIEQLNDNILKYTDEIAELKGKGFISSDNESEDDNNSERVKRNGDLKTENNVVIQSLEIKLNDYKRRIDQMEKENDKFKELEEDYCARVTKYEKMLEEKENVFKGAKQMWEKEFEALRTAREEAAGVEDGINDLQAKVKAHEETLVMKETEIEKLKAEVQGFVQSKEQLPALKVELEIAQEEHEKILEERDVLLLKEKELEVEIQRLRNEAKVCATDNAGMDLLKEKLRNSEDLVEEYKNKLEMKERRFEENNQHQQVKIESLKNAANSAVIKKLETTLSETSKALDKKNEQVIAKNNKIENLIEEVEQMTELIALEKQQVKKLEAQCEEYEMNNMVRFEEEKLQNEKRGKELAEREELLSKLKDESSNDKIQFEEKCNELLVVRKEMEEFERKVEIEMLSIQNKYQETRDDKDEKINALEEQVLEFKNKAEFDKLSTEEKYRGEIRDKIEKIASLNEELKEFQKKADFDILSIEEKYKEEIENKNTKILALEDEINSNENHISAVNKALNDLNKNSVEVEDLKLKVHEANNKFISAESNNEELRKKLRNMEGHLEEIKSTLGQEVVELKREAAKFKGMNQSLEESLENKKNDISKLIGERNALMDEKVKVDGELFKKTEMVSLLECKLELKKAENEFSTMQVKDQVKSALCEASKKEDHRWKEVEKTVKEHCDVIDMQKELIREQINELDELRQQNEKAIKAEQDLSKEKQLIHELRCSSIETENQLHTLKKEHDDTLEELEQVRCECLSVTVDRDTIKNRLKEREEQISKAREEVENLQDTVARLQQERDEAVRNSKLNSQDESNLKSTPSPSEEDIHRRSSEIPLRKLKDIILSSNKKQFDDDSDVEDFLSDKPRRSSRRIKSSSAKKENSVKKKESELFAEECSSSQKKRGRKQSKRDTDRKVLFDINEKTSDVFAADTPDIFVESAKPKRRRKLLSKNTGISGDSPQVIPQSPTHSTDPVQAIVRRQLRTRR